MQVGRSGSRTALTPNSSGMPNRAERILNRAASSYSAKLDNALSVDGVPIYIWNNYKGQHPCLCQSGEMFGEDFLAQETFNDGERPTALKSTKKRRFRMTTDRDADTSDNTTYFDDSSDISPKKKIRDDVQTAKDILGRKDIREGRKPFGDVLDALEDATNILDAAMVNCPICLGSGMVDSWKLEGCQRIMLEFSGLYEYTIGSAIKLEAQYPLFELEYQAKDPGVVWKVPFPAMWKKILRLALYDQERIVDNSTYILEYCLPDTTEYIELTEDSLEALNGNIDLSYGELLIRLRASRGNTITFTHLDIILAYDILTKAQFPDLDITYEDEFIDSNINVGIEVSAKAKLREGSYIYDQKYNRVWKIDSFTRKSTVSGVKIGHSANCRALHTFEKIYTLFKI